MFHVERLDEQAEYRVYTKPYADSKRKYSHSAAYSHYEHKEVYVPIAVE